ncbi:Pentatricopeptide repeat-containing protein [Forsythia ovata]
MDLKLRDFDSAPYNIWLIGLCQASRVEEAHKIFSILQEFRVNVSAPSCVMLIHGLCHEGKLDEAFEIFLYTKEKGYQLLPRICNNMFQALLCSREKSALAFELLSRMKSMGYNLNAYLQLRTKSLLHHHWNIRETEDMSTG